MEEAVQSLLRYGYWDSLPASINRRRNVITEVSKDLTACEEFMQLATRAHGMSAAIQITGVTNISSEILSSDKPMAAVKSLVIILICEMVRIEYIAGTFESTCDSEQECMLFLSAEL